MTRQTQNVCGEAMPLTTGQHMRHQINFTEDVTQEQEQALLLRIRQGDLQARDDLLLTVLLPYVNYWTRRYIHAYAWASSRLEYEDVLQAGMLAATERLDQSLEMDAPLAWLCSMSRHAINSYCVKYGNLIVTPPHEWKRPHRIESIDVRVYETDDLTWADLLVAPDVCPARTGEEAHPRLYRAINILTPDQREVMYRYYGLGDSVQEGLSEMHFRREDGSCLGTGSASPMHLKALKKLQLMLQSPSDMQVAYTVEQACQLLGVPPTMLARYSAEGHIRRLGRGYYHKEDVDALVGQRASMREQETYTAAEASELIGVSIKNLSRYVKQGCLRKVGHGAYAKEDVDALARKRRGVELAS